MNGFYSQLKLRPCKALANRPFQQSLRAVPLQNHLVALLGSDLDQSPGVHQTNPIAQPPRLIAIVRHQNKCEADVRRAGCG